MLLFTAFGIYVIVKKRVQITRSWVITGSNAQTFGAVLVATPILAWRLTRDLLQYVVPSQVLYHPIGGRVLLYLVLTASLLTLALVLRDRSDGERTV